MKKQLLLSFFTLFFGTLLTFAQTSPVCGGTFTDPEGATTNYADNSDYTVTIYPNNPGDFVTVSFTSFDIEANRDGLYIYNGNSINAPQISSANPAGNVPGGLPGAFWGTISPGSITSSSSDGSLTFRFRSDSTFNLTGWIANVTCGCLHPTGLLTSTVTTNTATLIWPFASATQWEVIIQPASMAAPTVTSTGVLTTTIPFTASGLLPATSYKAYVRTICSTTDSSNWTSSMSFTTLTCSFPTLITINSASPTSVDVSWTANSAATQWEVIIQPSSMIAPTSTSIGVVTNSSIFSASGLLDGTTYKAYVRTICSTTISSDWTSSSIFTTQTCSVPTSISINGISATSATLTWAVGSATQWEVIIQPVSMSAPTATSTGVLTNTNSYIGSGLLPATFYKAYVRKICSTTSSSNWTSPSSFFTLSCSVPTIITINSTSITSVDVSWTANSAATQWEVIIQPSSMVAPTSTSIGVVTNSSIFSASGLLDGTTYKAYVRTICTTTISSNWTSSSIFTTQTCSVPTSISLNGISATSATLTWAVGSATQWEVIIQPVLMSAPTATSTGVLTNTNSYIGSGLLPATSYKAYVRKICSTTSSSNWALLNFETLNCQIPTSISLSGISPTTVSLTWAVGSATQWEVLVRLAGEGQPGSSPLGTILVNQNTYTASGLITGTDYKFYVRTICGVNSMSNWSTGYAFSPNVSLPPLVTNTTTYTHQQLVTNVLVNNPCITISNITSSTGTNFGSTNGIGYFTNTNPTFPLSSGIVLSTGNANNVPGPNTSILSEGVGAWTGDSQLENIIYMSTGTNMYSQNATKLEFDFTSLNEFMSFNFLFASDEYGTFQCTYADAFAFLLTDLVTGITTNLAVVPGTTAPVSVVTIRDALYNNSCISVNPGFFDTYFSGATNYSSATNFNGQTAEMTASSAIIPNHPYHIKLVIADRSDNAYDSAVFIKAGSFTTGPPECSDKINLIAFVDANNNGIKDSGEVNFTYGSFVSQQNNAGPISNISSPFGKHTVYYSNPINTYDFSYSLNSEYAPYYSAGTTNYNDVSIALGSGTQTLYFPITLVSGYNDVAVSIVSISPPRPGFNYTNKIVYRNLGIATTSGQVSFTKDANATITSVSQPGIVSNSNGFTYDFANLNPYETRFINVTMSVPAIPIVNLNDVLINNATVSAPSGDINLSNNAFSNSQIVVASYDPNDKMESHGDKIQFNQFAASDYLYYTIRFQNEGTANALSVKIEDLLDSKLDETSIQMISASHGYVMERINNQIIWKFDYINLPPALSNEELSKGYVCFKIKLKPGFAIGDIIPNTANIYFDTNPAIVTNTFNTQFVSALGNLAFETSNFLLVPNPASNFVQVHLQNNSESIKSIIIYDILGKKVKEINEVNSREVQINTSDLSKGLYLVEITSDSFIKQIKKLVIN